ncbi:MAG: lysophospholipase [Chloroflexota bacterium]|nr:lysophospholipase [Chloroflexota bacterium]
MPLPMRCAGIYRNRAYESGYRRYQSRQSEMIEREHTFQNAKGITIFYREWLPDAGDSRGIALIVHGLGEHSGRYRHVAAALTETGFLCFGIDQLGHGKSGGARVFIPDLRLAVEDLRQLFEIVTRQYPQKPVFLFGHSMGSLTGLEFALLYPDCLSGIALSGVAIHGEYTRPPWLVKLCLFAAAYIPRLRLSPPSSPRVLTHDDEILKEWREDPLIDRGMWRVGTSAALVLASRRIRQSARQLTLPILALHGSDDHLAPPSGADYLRQNASSSDVSVKIYEGMRHELVNETCRDEVIQTLTRWMLERVAASVCAQ